VKLFVFVFVLVCVTVLPAVPVAQASERHPTQAEMEGEVMCPVCGTTLDQSESPAAQQIKRVIARRIAAGDTKGEIEDRLVANYGEAILAAPPHHGFGLLAWWLPIAGILAAAATVGAGAWRWSRTREVVAPLAPLDPALERRLDDELRRYES
jgi:cytochrome c-type biogenesis protein CcmH